MQILIPMTGYGSRFVSSGYKTLKPFIQVNSKPMIEWVTGLFPGDTDNITYICRQEHLDEHTYIQEELKRIAPKSTIFSIKNWLKKGPVYDVLRASECINDDEPAIISYCDFYMHWNYEQFKVEVQKRQCAGAVPCYSGFHPHLIPDKNLYASCKVDTHQNLIEIREKFSWTENKSMSLHSPGVYYFRSGELLKKYCQSLIDQNIHLNNEFYASLPYNLMVQDKLDIWCPNNVSHFCQWGTPEDLKEYQFWIKHIKGFQA